MQQREPSAPGIISHENDDRNGSVSKANDGEPNRPRVERA